MCEDSWEKETGTGPNCRPETGHAVQGIVRSVMIGKSVLSQISLRCIAQARWTLVRGDRGAVVASLEANQEGDWECPALETLAFTHRFD